ncbi:hypothetical protein N7526_003791 [Penicillium atrosanguineum]|nr:hypothetical protein N7526_003791 [Penicillium atrosanguineum]
MASSWFLHEGFALLAGWSQPTLEAARLSHRAEDDLHAVPISMFRPYETYRKFSKPDLRLRQAVGCGAAARAADDTEV